MSNEETLTKKRSQQCNYFGMLITLLGGSIVGILGGLIVYAIRSVIHFSIPLLFPLLVGIATGIVTEKLGTKVGRCRNQVLAILVAVFAATAGWTSHHVFDYLAFHREAFNLMAVEAPYASPQVIDDVIDMVLREETGQSGFLGYLILKVNSRTVEITPFQGGAAIGGFRLTGIALAGYWVLEVGISAGMAAYMNRSYTKKPYCEDCNVPRKFKVPVAGSVDRIEDVVDAFNRQDIEAALEALGTHSEGDIARLEMDFCPECLDNPLTRLVRVEDQGEYEVWSSKLTPEMVQKVLDYDASSRA